MEVKTNTLKHKIRWLLANNKLSPEEINMNAVTQLVWHTFWSDRFLVKAAEIPDFERGVAWPTNSHLMLGLPSVAECAKAFKAAVNVTPERAPKQKERHVVFPYKN